MSNDHTSVAVAVNPPCDFNRDHGPAAVDGATTLGPWANMCEACYAIYGVGLGLGRGQRLIQA